MRNIRFAAVVMAAVFSAACFGICPAAAEESVSSNTPVLNDEGYDISGFAWQWPEYFSKDDSVIVTENSYQSHDVNVQITRCETNRMSGDVNTDEAVTIADAVLCNRLVAEDITAEISLTGRTNADCNEDSAVTAEDTVRLLQWLSGLVPDEEFFVDHTLVYFVTDVHIRDINSLRGAFAQGEFPEKGSGGNKRIQQMAVENNAIFAINCDYCEIRDNGITYRNGVMYRETKRDEVAIIYKDGVMDVLTDAEYRQLTDEEKANIWQTTAFAPGLVKDGEAVTKFSGSVRLELHPRSGIGYYEPGHYCFLQVEGRQEGYSLGVTCAEFAQMFADLGCVEAFNMDGGSSSEIVFQGETVNHPAWNGRASSDILYICELPAEE